MTKRSPPRSCDCSLPDTCVDQDITQRFRLSCELMKLRLVAIVTAVARAAIVAGLAGGCGPGDVKYPPMGSLTQAAGKGGFRFGVATAATQIEDQNPNTDWYVFTRPAADG